MFDNTLYPWLLVVWGALAPLVLVALLFVAAPYGRHARAGWGWGIGSRLAWLLMESPTLWVFLLCVALAPRPTQLVGWILSAMYLGHYVHRVLIYPLRLQRTSRPMPASVVGMAFFFNLVNAYLQGRALHGLGPGYPESWLSDARFVVGAVLFVLGMVINIRADSTLLHLRRESTSGYQIPRGGLYERISCPNYFGEIVEWGGFALACWSPPALVFWLWVLANLAPRALAHHRWYRETFANYPPQRRALLPWVL
ncbi:MAG: DUF1295 domain-containing protein [Deltaproteobacteria bacterium]|nr:DUF1295 domain-containing protein [Deltaproteobacteria bacterium]